MLDEERVYAPVQSVDGSGSGDYKVNPQSDTRAIACLDMADSYTAMILKAILSQSYIRALVFPFCAIS